MNLRQSAFVSKMKDLVTFFALQTVKVATITAFKEAADEMATLVVEVEKADQSRETTTSGQAKIIAAAKLTAVKAIFRIATVLSTFAYKNKKLDLCARVTKHESDFAHLSESELVKEGKEIIRLAEENQAGLPSHGLKETEIADAKAAVEGFENSLTDRGTKDTQSIGETKSVYEIIAQMKQLLKNELNIHAKKFIEDDPEFYDGYKYNATVVYHPAHHKTDAAKTTDTTGTQAK
ncbi:MAG: hypothetical protein M1480_21630 [Bacteroidetes bacterium]|nr:hypothetical protein [Bacteroidota bacterium]